MAISAITTSMSAGVNYTATTDSSTDWSAVTNNTYFYDKTTKLVYFKNSSGNVIGTYDTFTGGTISGSTNFISGLTATTISGTTQTINNLILKDPYVPTGSTDPTGSVGTLSWSGDSFYVKTTTEWVKFTGITSW